MHLSTKIFLRGLVFALATPGFLAHSNPHTNQGTEDQLYIEAYEVDRHHQVDELLGFVNKTIDDAIASERSSALGSQEDFEDMVEKFLGIQATLLKAGEAKVKQALIDAAETIEVTPETDTTNEADLGPKMLNNFAETLALDLSAKPGLNHMQYWVSVFAIQLGKTFSSAKIVDHASMLQVLDSSLYQKSQVTKDLDFDASEMELAQTRKTFAQIRAAITGLENEGRFRKLLQAISRSVKEPPIPSDIPGAGALRMGQKITSNLMKQPEFSHIEVNPDNRLQNWYLNTETALFFGFHRHLLRLPMDL